ncbi:hypothetical protein C8F04DRAFT_1129554 [Mycena alexandri]|uniref:Uncharacterized protein n=1 Tax=Mycena alexandri TaxID=1745969 RepID=A0AAD6SFP0_9AGAR|nr:hypothetical protein C8F04DRAFT_1129554 [Mycena alexandri]
MLTPPSCQVACLGLQIWWRFPWVLTSSMSLLCGVSQNLEHLIAGRTVSGLGAAGIMVAMIQVIAQTTRLQDRPKLFGMFVALSRNSFGHRTHVGEALTRRLFKPPSPNGTRA